MSSVNKLLDLLTTPSGDNSGLLGAQNPTVPKGPQNGTGSFQDVLARLASQSGNANTANANLPAGQSDSSVSGQEGAPPSISGGQSATTAMLSETTVAITESVKASNPQQLAQAEQTLASLAVGLAHVINLLSQLQQGNTQQVQEGLKALGGGQVTLAGLQNFLNQVQALFQNQPAGQNPLSLQEGQQIALLGQLFQQMLQNQQFLFGVSPAGQTGGSNASQTGIGGNQTNAVLQVLFSDTQASLTQQSGTQTSQVFINLETFKMSATFIQEGQGNNLQQLPANEQNLLSNLNQAVANMNPSDGQAVILPAVQSDLNQNFKNLVQILMQSGVSQAVLTTFMRHQQDTENLNALPGLANAQQAPSSSQLVQGNQPPAEVSPINPTGLMNETNNNAFNASVAQNTLTSLPSQLQVGSNPSSAGNPETNNLSVQAALTTGVGENNSQLNTFINVNTTQNTPSVQLAAFEAPGQNNPRVNAVASQIFIAGSNAGQENQQSQSPNNASRVLTNPVPNPLLVAPTSGNGQARGLVTTGTGLSTASFQQAEPGLNGINPAEITVLNQTVARMNASALHDIQGSIGGNNSTPDSNLTIGQVLSAISANQLSSAYTPTFGNPSVPVNLPPASIHPTLPVNSAAPLTAGAVVPTQPNQNTTTPSLVPSNATQQVPAFSGPTVNASIVQQEPINQTAPILQTASAALPVAQTLVNNILGNGPVSGSANPNAVSAAVNTSNPAVTTNPSTVPVAVSNAVVPLPQPTTLPVGVNPTVQTNSTANVQTLTPAALNQTLNPPATSQAPLVPATAAVGEGVKAEIPATTVPRNENFANPSTVANTQPLSSVIPVSPEAVGPTGMVLGSATGTGILNVLDKNAPNNAAVLEANALLGLSSVANQPANLHTSSPAALSNNPGVGFDTTNLLNQISQQVALQTTGGRVVSRLNFQLIPESLGRVTVQIALVDQSVSARIMVTNAEVRENLQTHMVDLKSALNQAGLQIDQLQVQVQSGGGNLLAQYFQYQQEGSGYRQPVSPSMGLEQALNPENTEISGVSPSRTSLVDVLA